MGNLNYIFSNLAYFFQLFDQSKEIYRNIKNMEINISNKNFKFKSIGKKLSSVEKDLMFYFKKNNILKLELKSDYERQKNGFMEKLKKNTEMLILFKKKKIFITILFTIL